MPAMPNEIKPVTSPGGYSYQSARGSRRTTVGGGFSRYALEYDRGTQLFSVTLAMTVIQNQIWQIFFNKIIKKGTIPFTMPLDSGMGVADHTVNIVPDSMSTTVTNGTTTIVSFTVEAESQTYTLSDDDAQNYIDVFNEYGSSGVQPLLDALAQYATIDSNVLDY